MNFIRKTPLLALLLGWPLLASSIAAPGAEEGEKAKVLAVVERFFAAMADRDPVACKATLAPEGQMQVMLEGPKGRTMSFRLLGDFADGLPARKERPLERIWNPTVLMQERMAMVWAQYDFHRDGKFAHSGIDVFTLMRAGDDWKIVNLAFNIQPQVPSQHPAGPPRINE